MTTIVTRITNPTGGTAKGSPLTSQEIDQNFINLNDNKLEASQLNSNSVPASFTSLGVGASASGTSGRIDATTLVMVTSITTPAITVSTSAQINALGVGTAASSTAGEIRATNAITSYYSDERLKTNIELIPNALEKVTQLRGVTYNANQLAESFGYINKEKQVGVLAGDVEKVLPEAVKAAPFDIMIFENTEISKSGEHYKTVQYEKIVPLLIEAIKELNDQIKELKGIK